MSNLAREVSLKEDVSEFKSDIIVLKRKRSLPHCFMTYKDLYIYKNIFQMFMPGTNKQGRLKHGEAR